MKFKTLLADVSDGKRGPMGQGALRERPWDSVRSKAVEKGATRLMCIHPMVVKDAEMIKFYYGKSIALASSILMVMAAPVMVQAQSPAAKTMTAKDRAAAEQSATARLNAEQAAKAKLEAEAYQARVSAAEATVAQERAEFGAETATYEQRKAEAARAAARERLTWEADVKACEAGDTSRCAPPPTDSE